MPVRVTREEDKPIAVVVAYDKRQQKEYVNTCLLELPLLLCPGFPSKLSKGVGFRDENNSFRVMEGQWP